VGSLRRFCEDNFPFVVEVDTTLVICHLGPLMQRLLPHCSVGLPIWTQWRMRTTSPHPDSFGALTQWCGRNAIMDSLMDPPLVFRGTWYRPEGQESLLFLGWPWVLNTEDLPALGLSLNDFPPHTPLGDLLVLLRSNQNTLTDSRELSERLRQRSLALRATNQQLEKLAHFDPLTHMPNRVLLGDRLRQAMLQSQRRGTLMCVVYLDLDGFKTINDLWGHDVGDQFLATLAQRLRASLRDEDTLARLGGDEFVAVLGGLQQPQDCEPVLERMLQAARTPVLLADATMQVSASIGVTFSPLDPGDADLLMRHADQAMYCAKQAGKNRWHIFDLAQDAAVATRHENQEAIRLSMQNGEFLLYYQPLLDAKRQKVLGMEALLRWQRPGQGVLAPAMLLPQIQGHPLALSLGEWVLHTAVQQLSQWNTQGMGLGVSVNLDPAHLQSGHFVSWLTELLRCHPLVKPSQLTLEVLEGSAMEDMEHAQAVLRQCQALGVRCALDDFGTGYSSLTHLKQLGVDTLKIDRSFVMDMLDDGSDRTIVQAVVSLAQAFGCGVIAEGVETAEHAHALVSMGCSNMQGFGIARPMPAQEVAAWIAEFSRMQPWPGLSSHSE
jgi:diguanylate cyclase (GGDEF)-like protein